MSEFEYMLLGLLKDDCESCLRNGARYDTLWTGSPQRQIDKMLEIYDGLENKPEWISRADILDYAERMGVKVVYGRDKGAYRQNQGGGVRNKQET